MTSLGLPFVRRKDTTHCDDPALQHLLLNESIWSHAFAKSFPTPSRTRWDRIAANLQFIYEKSRVYKLFPIVLLIAYSLIGGLIFWSIERPHEETILQDKSDFIEGLKADILRVLLNINLRLKEINTAYDTNSYAKKLHFRAYRKFGLNQLHKTVYWYTLSVFYLTEHETYKASALRALSQDPSISHGDSNFGRIYALRNFTDQLALRCWEIGLEGVAHNWTDEQYRTKLDESVDEYNLAVGLNHVLTPVWTFWNAMFLAVTTYTTIGYGNITAKTKLGKLAAMVYAVIGIPLVLMILHKMGRSFLIGLEYVWELVMRGAEYMCFVSGGSRLRLTEEERISEMPLLLAIGVAFGWMFLCAAIFLQFEKDWDYFKSFYFFFCSLTTIGYGDVTPTKSEDMFIIFGLIIVGLSLVSMCINVIQLKLEKLFEELLLTLMEEYSSDPEGRMKGGQIGMREMWRAWKKRKGRLRDAAVEAAASRNNDKASLNLNLQSLQKVIPFTGRHQRHQLIEQLQQRLRQKDKSTQTDSSPFFLPICEEAWTETSDMDNESCATASTCGGGLLIPSNSHGCAPSPCESHPVVAQSEASYCSSSSLQPTTMSLPSKPRSVSSGVSKIRSERPQRNRERRYNERVTIRSSLSTVSSRHTGRSDFSAQSAPVASPSRFPIDFDPNRRWTFVASGARVPRGTPRGLVVPFMYTRREAPVVHTTEMKRLLAEIDYRLQDCRYLNTPLSSFNGSASSDASMFK